MNLVITLTTAGTDTGPFNLYSDVDGFTNAFDVNISKAVLLSGFATSNVPNGTLEVRVQSVNALCNNYGSVGITTLEYYFEPQGPTTYINDFSDSGTYAYIYGYFNGYFNGSSTVPGNHLVKIKSDKTVDTSFDIGEGFNFHTVYSGATLKELPNGRIVLVGFFTSFNGTIYNRIIRLNTDGSVDNTFNIGTGFNDYTTSIQVDSDGKYLITGIYSTYNGITSPRLIRLLRDGSVDNTFDVGVIGFNNSTVFSLLNDDNSLYVSGYFTKYKAITVPTGIVKIGNAGEIDVSFDGGVGFNVGNNQPISLARIVSESSFYAAGYFTQYKGVNEPHIIKISENGDKDISFDAGIGFNGDIGLIKVIWTNKLFILGIFTDYDGTASTNNIILNADGTVYHTFSQAYEHVYVIGNDVFASDFNDFLNKKIFTHIP